MNLKSDQSYTTSPRNTRNKDDSNFHFQQDSSKWRKKAWNPEEDEYLKKLVAKYGAQKWTIISQNMPGRIGKQCRERWHNHLNPDINKDQWALNEEWLLFLLHKNHGNQWAHFTRQLIGRTDNAIKNHWNSAMKKKAPQFMDKYKKAKAKFENSKNMREFDKYIMEQLTENHRISELQEIENNQKSKMVSEDHIKSEATIINKKEENLNPEDIMKTAKKPSSRESTQCREETTAKSKRSSPHIFTFPINSRLSQMSIFGGLASGQNIASAFSLLDQQEPIVLEPQPSINDISLSFNCLDQIGGQNQTKMNSRQNNLISSGVSLRRLQRSSLQRQRMSQTSLTYIK